MQQRALFVSDVHLNDSSQPQWTNFSEFLDFAISQSNLTDLFLVGDIFDLWLSSHSYFIKKHGDVVEKLRALHVKGVKIHYFEGNHDLYLNDFWKEILDFKVYSGPAEFKINDLMVRVEHGDQIDPTDRGYLFLRWFLRTRFMKWFCQHWPEKLVVGIGERASKQSRKYTSNYKTLASERSVELMRTHGHSLAQHENLDIAVLGHIHVKFDETLTSESNNSIRCINLGTWLDGSINVFEIHPETGPNWLNWR